MSKKYKLIKHWTISPEEGNDIVYYIAEGTNGNVYQYGFSDSPVSFAGGEVAENINTGELEDVDNFSVYESPDFMGFLKAFIDNEIGIVELGHLKMRMQGDTISGMVSQEIFSLSPEDIGWINSNFDVVDLVEKLGLFSLAQVMMLAGVFGDLSTEEGAGSALSIMANISVYWINHKGSTEEGVITDAEKLAYFLVASGQKTQEQADALLALFTTNVHQRLNE